MPDLVRVRVPNSKGVAEINHTREWAERHGFEVVDRPAVTQGRPTREKQKVSVAEAAGSKQPTNTPSEGSATPASNQEESK